jgi:hypothetical protein
MQCMQRARRCAAARRTNCPLSTPRVTRFPPASSIHIDQGEYSTMRRFEALFGVALQPSMRANAAGSDTVRNPFPARILQVSIKVNAIKCNELHGFSGGLCCNK